MTSLQNRTALHVAIASSYASRCPRRIGAACRNRTGSCTAYGATVQRALHQYNNAACVPVFPGCHGSFPVAIIIGGVLPWMSLLADTVQNSGQNLAGFIFRDGTGFAQRLCDDGRAHQFVVSSDKRSKINVADAVNDYLPALAFVGNDSKAVTLYPPRRELPISWSFSSPIASTVIR